MEAAALSWFLQNRSVGHAVNLLQQNYRIRRGEIDLVLEEDSELVFVEVRYRDRARSWTDGVQSVSAKKRSRLLFAARHFLTRYRGPARSIRFDILAFDGQCWTHVTDAFSASL